jgi:hypothetical protein
MPTVAATASPAPAAAPPLPVSLAPKEPAAPAPKDDIFRLPRVAPPRPQFSTLAPAERRVPPTPGIVFAGLGTTVDRARYVRALVRGGVFGRAERAELVVDPAPPASAPAARSASAPSVAPAFAVPASEPVVTAPPTVAARWSAPVAEPAPVAPPEPAFEAPGEPLFELPPEPAVPMVETAPTEAAEPLEAPAPSPAEPIPPTTTLGELYLSQGHSREAETIFERVLESEPGNSAAREGLESARRQVGGDPRAGVTARKVSVLQDFLRRVRGPESHVS